MEYSEFELVSFMNKIEDPRINRTKLHRLSDILVITICATICGADNWVEVVQWAESRLEWLQKVLFLPNGIPSHDTFARVFSIISPDQFQVAFADWVQALRQNGMIKSKGREVIAIDGKVIGGNRGSKRRTLGVVNAWSTNVGLSLGFEEFYPGETTEQEAGLKLLEYLLVKGCILTFDAGAAGMQLCRAIRKKKADYVICLKGNRGILHRLAQKMHDGLYKENAQPHTVYIPFKEEKGHGRKERRAYALVELSKVSKFFEQVEKDSIDQYHGTLKSLGRVESWRNGDVEIRYFLTSLKTHDLQDFARAVRDHWQVENQLHWVLDVAFREDDFRTSNRNTAKNLAVLKRFILNLFRQEKTAKGGFKTKRKRAAWDPSYLTTILESL